MTQAAAEPDSMSKSILKEMISVRDPTSRKIRDPTSRKIRDRKIQDKEYRKKNADHIKKQNRVRNKEVRLLRLGPPRAS